MVLELDNYILSRTFEKLSAAAHLLCNTHDMLKGRITVHSPDQLLSFIRIQLKYTLKNL